MNLYILNDILEDYTSGMCVIAAESLSQCKTLFMEEFGAKGDSEWINQNRQQEFDNASVKVIEGVNHPAGLVSYVYGGG
jgi:hypothetical protein